jgi:sterol desaturase/sphingolipid hydroxylase (fatty acid hydroxylase superfamily)
MMTPFPPLLTAETAVAVASLLILWLLEASVPFFADRPHRLRHDFRNLAVGAINLALSSLVFAALIAAVTGWAHAAGFGLLNLLEAPGWLELLLALILFDGWMYGWHRANHRLPFLWRFHRMHHSDPEVDASTALRFHFGEIAISSALRLAVIPLLGMQLWQVLLYETILLPVIAFHHSNVALPERWDRWLRAVIVSPNMHRVHHSDWQPETDSNFASIFSWWDRLAGTFRQRPDPRTLRLGLREFDSPKWQAFWGLLRTPLAPLSSRPAAPTGLQEQEDRSRRAGPGPATGLNAAARREARGADPAASISLADVVANATMRHAPDGTE